MENGSLGGGEAISPVDPFRCVSEVLRMFSRKDNEPSRVVL